MNNELPRFEFQRLQHASQKLVNRLRTSLAASQESGVSILATELDAVAVQDPSGNPVTLSLVGQYGAGKSTLIKCLTQNENIAIDADVCTAQVTAYDWDGGYSWCPCRHVCA